MYNILARPEQILVYIYKYSYEFVTFYVVILVLEDNI